MSSASTGGARVGYIASNSTGIKISGQWGDSAFSTKTFTASSSDIRLKKNILPTDVEALPIIKQIGIYQFDWKKDNSHQKIGFIADYLQQQDENFALGGGYDEDGYMDEKVVNDFYLMGYVVKGMQELLALVESQGNKIMQLEKQLQAMA